MRTGYVSCGTLVEAGFLHRDTPGGESCLDLCEPHLGSAGQNGGSLRPTVTEAVDAEEPVVEGIDMAT